jgi:hypothetical protein
MNGRGVRALSCADDQRYADASARPLDFRRRQHESGRDAHDRESGQARFTAGDSGVRGQRNLAAGPARAAAAPLLVPDLAHSLDQRCRAKPVLASRLIDDMEQDNGWKSSPAVTLGYTTDRARTGTRSLRFHTLLRNEEYIRASRAPSGSFTGAAVLFDGPSVAASARLRFATPQDWSGFNRLSLWCYLHPTVNTANDAVVEFVLFQPLSGLPARLPTRTLDISRVHRSSPSAPTAVRSNSSCSMPTANVSSRRFRLLS